MAKPQKTLNAVIGDVIRGQYTTYGLTIEELAVRTGIAYGTLRKKIAGTSPIFVTELLAITRAIGNDLTPEDVIADAERIWARLSAASLTTDDITAKRTEKEAEARSMSIDQLAETKHAATDDPELLTDEPEAP